RHETRGSGAAALVQGPGRPSWAHSPRWPPPAAAPAMTLLSGASVAQQPPRPSTTATVLYDDRSVVLDHLGSDPARSPDALWIRKTDLPRVNGFEVKPQGACRADVCIPISKDMARGVHFNLTAFARKVGQSFVVDRQARVWSFGEIPLVRGAFAESRLAPDVAVPDRRGRVVHLSDFRGRKVLLVTWASW